MIMYQKFPDYRDQPAQTIKRTTDGALIPFDPANRDYQEYLKFLEEGGQPLPAENNGQASE